MTSDSVLLRPLIRISHDLECVIAGLHFGHESSGHMTETHKIPNPIWILLNKGQSRAELEEEMKENGSRLETPQASTPRQRYPQGTQFYVWRPVTDMEIRVNVISDPQSDPLETLRIIGYKICLNRGVLEVVP